MKEPELYVFLGGPLAGKKAWMAFGPPEITPTVEPELSEMLEASVKIMNGELVAVPGPRKAVYRLDDHAYRFTGWAPVKEV